MTGNHDLRDVVAKGHNVQSRHAVALRDLEASLCRGLHQDAHAGVPARQLEHRGEHLVGGCLEQNGGEVVGYLSLFALRLYVMELAPRGPPMPIAPRQGWAAGVASPDPMSTVEKRHKRLAFIMFPASKEFTAIITDDVEDALCHRPPNFLLGAVSAKGSPAPLRLRFRFGFHSDVRLERGSIEPGQVLAAKVLWAFRD